MLGCHCSQPDEGKWNHYNTGLLQKMSDNLFSENVQWRQTVHYFESNCIWATFVMCTSGLFCFLRPCIEWLHRMLKTVCVRWFEFRAITAHLSCTCTCYRLQVKVQTSVSWICTDHSFALYGMVEHARVVTQVNFDENVWAHHSSWQQRNSSHKHTCIMLLLFITTTVKVPPLLYSQTNKEKTKTHHLFTFYSQTKNKDTI